MELRKPVSLVKPGHTVSHKLKEQIKSDKLVARCLEVIFDKKDKVV